MPSTKEKVIKETSKRNIKVILPGETVIYQSNRITNGRFLDFSIYHTKIFVCLLRQLQTAIKAEMEGKNWTQLNLFEEIERNYLRIGIPLSEIAEPKRYQDVVESFADLRRIDYQIESPYSKEHILNTGLIESFETPIKESGRSIVYLKIAKKVASDLIAVAKNNQGKPVMFTRYLYEVVMTSRCKYTWKIYTLIESWKAKGGFQISLDKFRDMLGLNKEEYPNYSDLKRRVIIPAQMELDHKADCWFNCSSKEFEERLGNKVVGLRFKIITPELKELEKDRRENILQLLRVHAAFKQEHMDSITPIFYADCDLSAITNKIVDLVSYVKNPQNEVVHSQKYIISSLLKTFGT